MFALPLELNKPGKPVYCVEAREDRLNKHEEWPD